MIMFNEIKSKNRVRICSAENVYGRRTNFYLLEKCGIVHLPALHFQLPLQFGLSLLHRK